jgi:hypothetical protein
MELTLSITLQDGDDLGLVGELVALLTGHTGAQRAKPSPGARSRRDIEELIREYWERPESTSAYGPGTWQRLEAYEQAIALHARLPESIWFSMQAGAGLFPPGSSWTAADLSEKWGWPLHDVRQRLRNIPRSRAVREYVDELMMRLGLDPDDRDLYEAVKNAALQFRSETDGRVVHYTVTEELADEMLVKGDNDRMYGPQVDEELVPPEFLEGKYEVGIDPPVVPKDEQP